MLKSKSVILKRSKTPGRQRRNEARLFLGDLGAHARPFRDIDVCTLDHQPPMPSLLSNLNPPAEVLGLSDNTIYTTQVQTVQDTPAWEQQGDPL